MNFQVVKYKFNFVFLEFLEGVWELFGYFSFLYRKRLYYQKWHYFIEGIEFVYSKKTVKNTSWRNSQARFLGQSHPPAINQNYLNQNTCIQSSLQNGKKEENFPFNFSKHEVKREWKRSLFLQYFVSKKSTNPFQQPEKSFHFKIIMKSVMKCFRWRIERELLAKCPFFQIFPPFSLVGLNTCLIWQFDWLRLCVIKLKGGDSIISLNTWGIGKSFYWTKSEIWTCDFLNSF